MNFSEIFSDAIKYPFAEPNKFLIIGVIALLSGLFSSTGGFSSDSILSILFAIVAIVASLFIAGYGVSIIRESVGGSVVVPELDFNRNFVDGIKSIIIGIVYFIIPTLIMVILALISGVAIKLDLSAVVALGATYLLVAVILFIIFGILGEIALARFARTEDFVSSLNIFEVFNEVKQIGFFNVLIFIFVQAIVVLVLIILLGFVAFIPFIGALISSFLLGAFSVFFINRSLGLFYGNN